MVSNEQFNNLLGSPKKEKDLLEKAIDLVSAAMVAGVGLAFVAGVLGLGYEAFETISHTNTTALSNAFIESAKYALPAGGFGLGLGLGIGIPLSLRGRNKAK